MDKSQPQTQNEYIDWSSVRRVLVVRLRSIGDTVLSTPSLIALKRFLPDAQIDILLEDWVAPVLNEFEDLSNVLSVEKSALSRLQTAWKIRRMNYDVVFNLHGGTTGTFFAYASGAKHRVGYEEYQYKYLYNHRLSSATDYWQQPKTHSAEQQLALLGFVGVPVQDRPKSRLTVTEASLNSLVQKAKVDKFALIHPAAAFATKQWATEHFAATVRYLKEKGIASIAVASKKETAVLELLRRESDDQLITFDDLTLPEITALASKAEIFIGNDSGIAHIAAAVGTPAVVIFGSSNRDHWYPWTDAASEIVYETFACQPCPGYECKQFGEPRCILNVAPEAVFKAVDLILSQKKSGL